MWKMNVVFLHFAVVAVSLSSVSCISDNDAKAIRKTLDPLIKTCLEQCGLIEVKEKYGKLDPCLKKCFVKTLHVIDDKAQLDHDVLHNMFKQYVEDKEESMIKQKAFEECFDEENRSVTEDADAEMKRIDIIFICLRLILNE